MLTTPNTYPQDASDFAATIYEFDSLSNSPRTCAEAYMSWDIVEYQIDKMSNLIMVRRLPQLPC